MNIRLNIMNIKANAYLKLYALFSNEKYIEKFNSIIDKIRYEKYPNIFFRSRK